MKKRLFAALLLSAAWSAQASAPLSGVPEPLGSYLGAHQVKQAAMKDGVLRVQLEKADVSELSYFTFIYHGICAEQWRKPAAFNAMGLKRVEVFDAAGAKGFAFDGDSAICAEMGSMGMKYGDFIRQRSTACQAGKCTR
ncbi:hypothetical protein RQP54_15515 [Curvibacter sp. APW13]|uniref:hypothetical protein n=1 Tax=Curvibacter sp. APW13 TaxID=3077236 RepID=UPI0028DF2C6F|nr:hypothetical protein [Curvibacter sp. APW13]MDT8992280.1 hypothetical protein [Curvibacter sp. APW13]